jgi:hypothetical protein
MRVFSSWQFAGSASLLTTAVLLCLVPFLLSWPASGSEQVANGYPIDGQYLAMLAEEDKGSDELPKDAMLLTMLVLVYFFGPALGWLLASDWRGSRPLDNSPIRCCFHSMVHLHQRRELSLPCWGSSGCRALLSSASLIFLPVLCPMGERCGP